MADELNAEARDWNQLVVLTTISESNKSYCITAVVRSTTIGHDIELLAMTPQGHPLAIGTFGVDEAVTPMRAPYREDAEHYVVAGLVIEDISDEPDDEFPHSEGVVAAGRAGNHTLSRAELAARVAFARSSA